MLYNVRTVKAGGGTLARGTGVGKGGRRVGAGRKTAEELGVPLMEKHTITLTPEDIVQLKEMGGGYLSRGVREALRRLNELESGTASSES